MMPTDNNDRKGCGLTAIVLILFLALLPYSIPVAAIIVIYRYWKNRKTPEQEPEFDDLDDSEMAGRVRPEVKPAKLNNNTASVIIGLALVVGALYVAIGPDIQDRFFQEPTEEYAETDDYVEDSSEESDEEESSPSSSTPLAPTPSSSQSSPVSSAGNADDGDITVLADEPTASQETNLTQLARQKFEEQYPYEGSEMHNFLGVLKEWSGASGESWLFEVEATIVNEYGAERSADLMIQIYPDTATSGMVYINEI